MIRLESRRGLTLLETLIASAILAMLAAACLPMITRAAVLLRDGRETQHTKMIDLAGAADAFMIEPERFGIERDAIERFERTQFEWPVIGADSEPSPNLSIAVHALKSLNEDAGHCWLIFECEDQGGGVVSRWLALPKRDETREQEAPQ